MKFGIIDGESRRALVMGPPASGNFPWILLDRVLHHYDEIISRAHGKRDSSVVEVSGEEGWVTGFSRSRRMSLQKWFSALAKKTTGFNRDIYLDLLGILQEVEAKSEE